MSTVFEGKYVRTDGFWARTRITLIKGIPETSHFSRPHRNSTSRIGRTPAFQGSSPETPGFAGITLGLRVTKITSGQHFVIQLLHRR